MTEEKEKKKLNKAAKKAWASAESAQDRKDRVFSLTGLKKEFLRIRWPHWRTSKDHTPGILLNTGETILFTAVFAAAFVLTDMLAALFLHLLGI